jgi:hypothetical protein
MIAYKVVKAGGSIFAPGDWHVAYSIGKTTRAPEQSLGLFCFYTKERAVHFRRSLSRHNANLGIIRISVQERDIICKDVHGKLIAVIDAYGQQVAMFSTFYFSESIQDTAVCHWIGSFTAVRVRVLNPVACQNQDTVA